MSNYTDEDFNKLLCNLTREQHTSQSNMSIVIETLRSLTEWLIWADQHKLNFFDTFKSQNTLSIYLSLLREDFSKQVTIQLLQSANLLIHNLRDDNSKEYLLKSDFYKEVLMYPFDFADDEIIENYMSLLKGLAVNVTIPQLRQYMLDNNFALFTGAMTFFNYKEPLIKTASRTVILRILSINEESIDRLILDSGFFYNLVSNFKESIIAIARDTRKPITLYKLCEIVEEAVDLLYQFNDIFNIGRELFNLRLSNIFLKDLILPILIGSITESKPKSYHLPIPICIYMLSKILYVIKYSYLINKLVFLLFSTKISRSYLDVIINPPNRSSPFPEESQELVENPLYENIISFLCCKEDNLLGLSLYLLETTMSIDVNFLINHCHLENSPPEKYIQYVMILGDIILAEEELRFFTSFLASKVMFDLSVKAFDSTLSVERGIVENALVKWKGNALSSFDSFHDPMKFVGIFEEEWEFINQLNWVNRLELPLNYILPTADEKLMGISLENRRSVSEEDFTRHEIRLYLLYRKFNNYITKTNTLENQKFECPLKDISTHLLEINKVYHFSSIYLKDKTTVKVIVKAISSSPCFIIDDPNFLVLSQKTPDGLSLKIEYLARFSKIAIKNVNEPNSMIVFLGDKNQLMLNFEEYSVWINAKNKMEKKIRECRDNEVKLLKSFIQEAT
ncbi:hypothetical protein SteCoe_22032 [Stentor coeruleus]|uniref:Uncharacterized protein n=1 Tax=Stentor coeruleus TaxID=5963 RepID=A0A1R2BMZ4_9CILI|nr:hypothetical protein SteCoe_22032 [Stentor coeruleus]